jgi:hypothetical protein
LRRVGAQPHVLAECHRILPLPTSKRARLVIICIAIRIGARILEHSGICRGRTAIGCRMRTCATVLILFEGITCTIATHCDSCISECLTELDRTHHVDIGFAHRRATIEPRAMTGLPPIQNGDRDRNIEAVNEADVIKVHAVEGIQCEFRERCGFFTDGHSLALGPAISCHTGHPRSGDLTSCSRPHATRPIRGGGLDGAGVAGWHGDCCGGQ